MVLLLRHLTRSHGVTFKEAGPVLGIHERNARQYLRAAHQKKVLYISGWRREGTRGPCYPIYSLAEGPSQDAPYPDVKKLKAQRRRALRRAKAGFGGVPL